MKRATALVPVLFCLEGVLYLLRAMQFMALFAGMARSPLLSVFWQAFAPHLLNAFPVLGISSLIIAWGLYQRKQWGWRGGVVLALLQVLIFPFLTVIGLVLLVLLIKGKQQMLLSDPLARMRWDQKQEKRLPAGYLAIVMLVIAAIGFGAYTLVQYSQSSGYPALPLWAIPFTVVASVFIAGVVHEAGHLAASKVVGFQLANLSIGPFWLSRNLVGWNWKFVPNLGWTGALAAARPLTDYNLNTNVFLFLAGGPLATLLLGSVSLTMFLSARHSPWSLFADGFGILAMVALIDFLSEMSLVRKGHVFTDGARLMQLWTGGMERRRLLATYALGLCETTARRPSEWRPEWLAEPTADPNSPLYFAGCYYAYVYDLDRQNWDGAGRWLDQLLGSEVENPSSARRWKAAVEGAYFEALFRGDAVRGRQWLSAPKDGLAVEPVSEWRAEAAVHLAEGDLEGCNERILKIRTRLAEVPETGWKSFELALAELLEDKLRSGAVKSFRALDAGVRLQAIRAGNSLQSSPGLVPLSRPSVPAGSAISPLPQ